MKPALLLASLVLGAFALPGCAGGPAVAPDENLEAVACPKCETVWVPYRTRHGTKNIWVYRGRTEMTCPDCNEMAMAYLEGDHLVLHDCPQCQVAPKPYRPAPPAPGHAGHKATR
jgi:predicted RNA-binding Zn-ribbon protein involved in translation (DUF1610 family)